ncbi:LPXTG cell wall anchor domain-containing protein [Apilactobacillus kunkeei]|uniref:mucin-binding protein n=1 Tax=Apilactobacillus kunkeei TaxID=148814 RepID=UPI00110CB328|nr:MucBP domain-containing protein [Apilactobacillus kunkeei]TMT02594.1 LPXTG cell wall anchor domain-containing protein [Apilactobacillus kunkeei]
MKKNSIKTAILFSTLVFGTVQANALVHQNETFSVVAHADSDTSTTNINQIKDPTIKNILLTSVNSQENKGYQNASEITNDDLQKLTSINYTGNGSAKVLSLDNFNINILPNIQSISIGNVDMSSVKDLSPFAQWNKLSSVSLSNDKISSDQLSTLGKWSADDLTNLDLSNNNISNLSFLKNISIPNIQSIDVNHNQIADFTPVVSQDWTKLTDLNVGFNNIEDISPIATVNWPSLQNLNVESNKISDISVISTANWPNLQSLDADNNNISNINAFADTNWTNLKTISASGNKIQNVNALGGKSSKFKNLDVFKVSNNSINDISWMSGFKFNSDSIAKNQNVTDTQVITKPENGQSVLIPVTIKDVTLGNGLNWTYVASDDNAGTNLEASPISDPTNATIIGNDGQPFKLVQSDSNRYSNGIKGINLKYDGSNTSTVSFNFASNFGINQSTYFTGLYTLKVNWATANTQSKNVKVTVKYVDQNGNTISKPETKTVTFTETGKKVDATGEQIWNNDWKATGDTNYSFSSPSVDGYKLADESQQTINGNVNSDSGDINETVVYKSIQSESNSDSNSHSSASSSSSAQSSASSSVAQSSSAQSSASSSVAQSSSAQSSASSSESQNSSAQSSASSSVAQSSSAQSSVAGSHSNNAGNPTSKKSSTNTTPNSKSSSNHGNNAGNPNRTVTIKHVDPAVSGNNNKASHHDAEGKNKLPQTGDKTEQNVLISLGAVAIATALGLAAFALRRKNK